MTVSIPPALLYPPLLAAAIAAGPAHAQTAQSAQPVDTAASPSANEEVTFSADTIDYDFEADVVTATGDVILNREGYRLRADRIVWNRQTGAVDASGGVRTVSPEGDVVYSDAVTLTDSLRDGAVENLLLVLNDGSRLAARRGTRFADGSMSLDVAAYTACAVTTPDGCPKNPSWQIKAVEVRYDPVRERVSYEGARIELFGLPVIPLPGLSHPIDGAERSGLLVPDLTISSSNGVSVALPYYFNLAPNQDATVTARVFTEVAPMISGTYRSLDDDGAFQMTGYATYSSKIPLDRAPLPNPRGDFRGYFETSGAFVLDPNWTVAQSARITSDKTFLRRYDISEDDTLRSSIAAERIDRNSYFGASAWAFQTLRTNESQGRVPVALPRLDYRRRFDDAFLGGNAQVQLNSLSILRTAGQDTQRAFAMGRWDLRDIAPGGQEITLTGLVRGDVYHSSDTSENPIPVYRGEGGWQARGVATAAVDVKWPFVGPAFGGVQTITPRLQIVATPGIENLDIPNEDSRAVDLEDTNLFALNRFPGYDRYEDNVRATYGVEWNLDRPGWRVNAVVGQSYRLANNSNIVPEGTGLSERFSDIVGRTDLRFRDFVKFTHRYRLDKDNLAIRRNEIDATVGGRSTYLQFGYLRLNRDIPLVFEDLRDREEVRLGGRYQIDRYWSVFGSAIIDLTDAREDPFSSADGFEPVRHRVGVAYDDDCLSFGLTWRYDYEDTGDAERGSTFLLRLSLRNLGV